MSRFINKMTLVGNCGREPSIQATTTGTKIARVSLGTTRRVARNGGFEERTEWHRLTMSGRLAEIAEEYIHKGDRLYVEGRMEYSTYEKNGIVIPTADVVVRELVLLNAPVGSPGAQATEADIEDDDQAW